MSLPLVYLDTYVLQSDLRIRVPKSVINNLNAIPGKTEISFYFDCASQSVVMRVCGAQSEPMEKTENEGKKNDELS